MSVDIAQHCPACVAAVIQTPRLLIASKPRGPDPAWIIGEDARRHWVRDGAAVCDPVLKVLKR